MEIVEWIVNFFKTTVSFFQWIGNFFANIFTGLKSILTICVDWVEFGVDLFKDVLPSWLLIFPLGMLAYWGIMFVVKMGGRE